LFFVDSRYQQMARRPGGVPHHEALSNAQRMIDELKPEFVESLDQELGALKEALSDAVDTMADGAVELAYQRCSHLRDLGSTMGFALVSFIAGNLCELLDTTSAGVVLDRDVVNCHVDALYLAKSSTYCRLRPDQVPEMILGLQRVTKVARSR
jgi:hypothetical protein